MPRVSYIPTQTPDEAAFSSTRAALESPFRLLFLDAAILLRNLRYIPNTVLPQRSITPLSNVHENEALTKRDTRLTIAIASGELLTLALTIPVMLLFRGWIILAYFAFIGLAVYTAELPMWGGLIVQSSVNLHGGKALEKEKWFFINGIGTSHTGLQTTCDRLAATFKRPITGIHNRSYGIIGDVLECLIQRCLQYNTTDVRTAYECLKINLLDPDVEKVVVIAHSQGGIIISLALDHMFVELPHSVVSKLEIYTFGSAAAHFNNPLKPDCLSSHICDTTSAIPSLRPKSTHVIRTIEHYCNELDLVPRWGVLYNTQQRTRQRYAGRVFISRQASGHLFNEHYLDVMFPPSIADSWDGPRMNHFLDQIVAVDESTALRRAERVFHDCNDATEGVMAVPESLSRRVSVVDETQMGLMEGSGRTVRQLSRLWMYVGGGEAK